jgi:FtsP/CotA-like multicopper oxidase with cupredoxin domain
MAKKRILARWRGLDLRRPVAAFLGLFMLAGAAAADSDEIVRFDLALQGLELRAAENVIRVQQGDRVEIGWTSDEPASVHLHGYDIELQLHPGEAAVMAFDAEATGRFPVELHGGHAQDSGHHGGALLYVEVHPR